MKTEDLIFYKKNWVTHKKGPQVFQEGFRGELIRIKAS
jgi:hypothetical protein